MVSHKHLIKARNGDTCTCGCEGRDPWHRQLYRRVIRKVVAVRKDLGDGRFVVATGTAQFPWGVEPVQRIARVLDGQEHIVGWEIRK